MNAGANIVSAVLTFVSLMFMTRYVPAEYGTMMWCFGIVATFGAVTDLGFNSANIKYISEGRDQNDCFSTYLLIKTALAGILSLLVLLTILFGTMAGKFEREHVIVMVIFMIYYAVLSFQTALLNTFNGRQENGKASVILLIEIFFRTALLIVFAIWGSSATQLSQAYIVGGLASLIASIVMLKGTGIKLVRPTLLRLYFNFTAPLIISVALIAIISNFDKVVVGAFKGDMEVAYYSAVAGIVWGFATLSNSLNSVILPHLADYDIKTNREPAKNLLWTTEKYLFMLILPCISIILILSPQLCGMLFGEDFRVSGKILVCQAGVIGLFAYVGLASQILFSTNHASLYTKTTILNVIITLVLFFLLIPDGVFGENVPGLGGAGAALAISSGYVAQAISITIAVKRVTGIGIFSNIWKHAVAFATSASSLYFLSTIFIFEGLLQLFMGIGFCITVHFLVLILLKEFGKDDIRFVRNALSPKNLYDTLNEEFEKNNG